MSVNLAEQLDRDTLKKNIYLLSFQEIIRTQKLDVSFIVKYLLNEKYQIHKNDAITLDDVFKYQIHINKDELIKGCLCYDSDEDSIPDFESVSKNN